MYIIKVGGGASINLQGVADDLAALDAPALVVLGANAAETAPMDVRRFYFGQYDLLGTTMGNVRDFTRLLGLLAEHRVPPPVIDRIFPLDQAAEAHEHLENARGFGKTVMEIA